MSSGMISCDTDCYLLTILPALEPRRSSMAPPFHSTQETVALDRSGGEQMQQYVSHYPPQAFMSAPRAADGPQTKLSAQFSPPATESFTSNDLHWSPRPFRQPFSMHGAPSGRVPASAPADRTAVRQPDAILQANEQRYDSLSVPNPSRAAPLSP